MTHYRASCQLVAIELQPQCIDRCLQTTTHRLTSIPQAKTKHRTIQSRGVLLFRFYYQNRLGILYQSRLNLVRQPFCSCDGFESFRVEFVPTLFAGMVNGCFILEHAIAQVVLTHPLPDALHGHQLRRIRRQKQQCHRLGHLQCFGFVPSCAIENQHHMHIAASFISNHLQMSAHQIRVDRRRDQRRRLACHGIDRAKDIAPFVFGLTHAAWATATLCPHARQRALLADFRGASFVLEPDCDLFLRVFSLDFADKKGASSTHCAMAWGSDLRCWGRGTRTDKFSRSNRSYTPESW